MRKRCLRVRCGRHGAQCRKQRIFSPGMRCGHCATTARISLRNPSPGVAVHSLWELIDQDADFLFPDYHGMQVTVQDCWRSRERMEEQDAVRSLLHKMNIAYVEAREHHADTDFCGATLYRPQVARNPKLAPKHYVEGAVGKFQPHTPEEQEAIMQEYCRQFTTKTVVCYCHYCLEGLQMGQADGWHIAELLFPAR